MSLIIILITLDGKCKVTSKVGNTAFCVFISVVCSCSCTLFIYMHIDYVFISEFFWTIIYLQQL